MIVIEVIIMIMIKIEAIIMIIIVIMVIMVAIRRGKRRYWWEGKIHEAHDWPAKHQSWLGELDFGTFHECSINYLRNFYEIWKAFLLELDESAFRKEIWSGFLFLVICGYVFSTAPDWPLELFNLATWSFERDLLPWTGSWEREFSQ